jgi:replicative DNA helicase
LITCTTITTKTNTMIERLILTGLINSKEFLQRIRPVWNSRYLQSRSATVLADWCVEFYDQNQSAPERLIEDVYYDKKERKEIPKDMIEEILEDLQDLAAEYDQSFNTDYVWKRTTEYFKKRHLELHQEEVKKRFEDGDIDAAEYLTSSYRGLSFDSLDDLDLSKGSALQKIDNAFLAVSNALIEFPGALGTMMNDQLTRGSFVALMAAEKRGKTWWLLEMAIKASYKRNKVAFFQAGDMTEAQQIKRVASNLTKLPTLERYVGETYVPHADCILNQLDMCDEESRLCDFGVFTGGEFTVDTLRDDVTREDLIEAYKDFGKDYRPCTNCEAHGERRLGTPWLKPVNVKHTVDVDAAKKKVQTFFINKKRGFKMSTHPNNTLTISKIKAILSRWELEDGFVPDVIVIDYADLLVAEHTKEFRHAQNEIWKNLRALSQEYNCLVLTATQADAKSYEKPLLGMSNYSEDKRKFAHVTAMFGLNQDKHNREKRLGVMRVNQIVIREGEFISTNTVSVLQALTLGRPYLDSYI